MSGSGLFNKQRAAIPHLSKGEVADLRRDIAEELAPLVAITAEEFIDVLTADPDAFKQAIASVEEAVDYSGEDLDGDVGTAELTYPRNVTVTTAGETESDAPATVTFTGEDVYGKVITETLNVPQSATTAVGNKAFKKVTRIQMPAGDGTGALVSFGFGVKIGLSKKIVTRAGMTGAIREFAAGSANPTAGTLADATTGAPNGTYSPNTAPNGTNAYCVFYEYDPTAG